jgi:hypothetical protein
MTKETKKASEERAEFRRIYGGDANVQRDFYAEFMRRLKERGEDTAHGRSEEWALRFKRGDEFQFVDREHRQILLDIMSEGLGDGTAGHLDKEDVKRFCERYAEHKKTKKLKAMS